MIIFVDFHISFIFVKSAITFTGYNPLHTRNVFSTFSPIMLLRITPIFKFYELQYTSI